MLNSIRRLIRREEGISTLEFLTLLPFYLIMMWICLEAMFVYDFVIFDGFGDARNEILQECYKANSETIRTFEVKGGLPIINDLIDLMTFFFPDTSEFRFKIASAGK